MIAVVTQAIPMGSSCDSGGDYYTYINGPGSKSVGTQDSPGSHEDQSSRYLALHSGDRSPELRNTRLCVAGLVSKNPFFLFFFVGKKKKVSEICMTQIGPKEYSSRNLDPLFEMTQLMSKQGDQNIIYT